MTSITILYRFPEKLENPQSNHFLRWWWVLKVKYLKFYLSVTYWHNNAQALNGTLFVLSETFGVKIGINKATITEMFISLLYGKAQPDMILWNKTGRLHHVLCVVWHQPAIWHFKCPPLITKMFRGMNLKGWKLRFLCIYFYFGKVCFLFESTIVAGTMFSNTVLKM